MQDDGVVVAEMKKKRTIGIALKNGGF